MSKYIHKVQKLNSESEQTVTDLYLEEEEEEEEEEEG
jgi:hypothetical protein